jgi:hypothetical protein
VIYYIWFGPSFRRHCEAIQPFGHPVRPSIKSSTDWRDHLKVKQTQTQRCSGGCTGQPEHQLEEILSVSRKQKCNTQYKLQLVIHRQIRHRFSALSGGHKPRIQYCRLIQWFIFLFQNSSRLAAAIESDSIAASLQGFKCRLSPGPISFYPQPVARPSTSIVPLKLAPGRSKW